jgi:hypothetical protein
MSDLTAQITHTLDPSDFPQRRTNFVAPERITIGRTISKDPDEDEWHTGALVFEDADLFTLTLDGDAFPTSFPKRTPRGYRMYSKAMTGRVS